MGLGHLVQECGGLLTRGPVEFQALTAALEQATDGGDGRVLRPFFAEEVGAELYQDPFDAGLTAFTVVTEVMGEVRAEEQHFADLQRGDLVADPAFGAAAEQEENLDLRVVMPDAAEVPLAQVLARDEFVRRGGRLLFLDESHAYFFFWAGFLGAGWRPKNHLVSPDQACAVSRVWSFSSKPWALKRAEVQPTALVFLLNT